MLPQDFHALLTSLELSATVIEDYFKMVPPEAVDVKRGEDCWTLKKHLFHLVKVQEISYNRILLFKNEESPVVKPYFPQKDEIDALESKSISEGTRLFKEWRTRQLELLNQMDDSHVGREGSHDEFTQYNLRIVLNHILFHDYWHMYRIEELWLTKDSYFNG